MYSVNLEAIRLNSLELKLYIIFLITVAIKNIQRKCENFRGGSEAIKLNTDSIIRHFALKDIEKEKLNTMSTWIQGLSTIVILNSL